MNSYCITIERPEYGYVYIHARTEEEAREKYYEGDNEIEWNDYGDDMIAEVTLDEEDVDDDEEEDEITSEKRQIRMNE